MIICTIISSNYTTKAKCMLKSLQKFYKDLKLEILITDIEQKEADAFISQDNFIRENFKVHVVDELKIDDIDSYRSKYSQVEWNTFLKPRFLLYLLKKSDKVIYTDSDIQYYGTLQEIENLLDGNNIILTPHRLFDEKKNLNSLKMLEYGYYNLGFIAVSKSFETDRFLNWWHWKLTEHGYLNLDEHLAWDQKWCDLVPIYFDGVHILKNPGYNVAFWNIFERHISENQGKYWVNEKYPLRFIHFSHYMPEYPEYMRSVPIEDSFTEFPKNEPVLKALFDRYYEVLTDN